MHTDGSTDREARGQKALPFADSEAARAERRNELDIALLRVDCDLHLAKLVDWIYNTEERTGKPLIKSRDELARRPRGLCCSKEKVSSTIRMARCRALVRVDEQIFSSGGQRANAYSIDWNGVRSILRGAAGLAANEAPPGLLDQGAGLLDQGAGLLDQGAGPIDQPFKEYNLFSNHLKIETTETSTVSDDGGQVSWEGEEGTPPGGMERGGQATALRRSAVPSHVDEGRNPADSVSQCLLDDVEELAAARSLRLRPLDALAFRLDVFRPLTLQWLNRDGKVIEWFRRQLAALRPVCGADGVELLLALAMRRHALEVPDRDVRKNRVAIFASRMRRREWGYCLAHVPEAWARLQDLLAQYGDELLLGDTWPPRPRTEAAP